MRALVFLLVLAATPAPADTLVASHTIRAQSILGPQDLALMAGDTPGALSDPAEAIGMEARVNLYAGRPLRPGDLGPPAIVDRNQIVTLRYRAGGLNIVTEARALDRAGVGDRLRVMNLASRNTVTGRVTETGEVIVAPPPDF